MTASPRYLHAACDKAILAGNLEAACEGCRNHLTGQLPEQPKVAVPVDFEEGLDLIMEDLIVGHNFDYARTAIINLFEKHRATLHPTQDQIIEDQNKYNDRVRGVKTVKLTEYELMLTYTALRDKYRNNGGGRRWPIPDEVTQEFHDAMLFALRKLEEANGEPFPPAQG